MWLILLLLQLNLSGDAHEFHVSRTLMNYNQETQRIEITQNIFIEDIELAIETRDSVGKLKLGSAQEIPKGDSLIMAYINDHFILKSGEKRISLNYLGKEMADDLHSLWFYYETDVIKTPVPLDVRLTVLTEIYSDQQNILRYVYGPDDELQVLMHKDLVEYEFAK